MDVDAERELIRDNAGMAFVNGKLTHAEAAEALTALEDHWAELDTPARGRE